MRKLFSKIDRAKEIMWLNHYVTVQTIAQLNFEKERLDDFIESIQKKSKKSEIMTSFKNKDITQHLTNVRNHPKTRKIDENIPRFPIHIFKSLQKVKPESKLNTPTVAPLLKLDDKILPVNVFRPENVTIKDQIDLTEDFQITRKHALESNKSGILYEERNFSANISNETVEKDFGIGSQKIYIPKNFTELHEEGSKDLKNSTSAAKNTSKLLEKTEAGVHK